MPSKKSSTLTNSETDALLHTLQARFEKHQQRHKGIEWVNVVKKLTAQADKLWSIQQMEATDGEPDVVAYDKKTDTYTFFDCVTESPKARRSVCYDPQSLEERKEFKPKHSAIGMATAMGIELLDEAQFRYLQTLGKFDTKTSSWLKTPDNIRKLGGAIFGNYRFDTVFIYHNGVQSYYGSRGFRGWIKV